MFVTHDVDEALYLADRIIVLSNKPTTVIGDYVLTHPRPRDISNNTELRDLKREIFRGLGVDPGQGNADVSGFPTTTPEVPGS